MTHPRFVTADYSEWRAAAREEFAALAILLPLELAVGDRVQEVYAETWGTVAGFVGQDEVLVDWDDPQAEDLEAGPVLRHELIKPQP